MKAFIVHKAELWTKTVGSLLLLFREFGYKCWLKPEQIENYDAINLFDHHHEQDFEFKEDIAEMIRIGIYQHKYELLKYKKGAKI